MRLRVRKVSNRPFSGCLPGSSPLRALQIGFLMLFCFPVFAAPTCTTQALITFDASGTYTGATFETCEIEVLVPSTITIPGFSVDANGDVVNISWKHDGEDVNGDPLTIEKYVVSIDGNLTDIEPDKTQWTSGFLPSGNHSVKMKAVRVSGVHSEFNEARDIGI